MAFKKYINYFREAFMSPVHLIGLGIAGIGLIAGTIALSALGMSLTIPAAALFGIAGLDMIYLGLTSRSERFHRAVNAKYAPEIEAYEKAKSVTNYYNNLSAPRQRRFEHFKATLDEIRSNYTKIHADYPDVVNKFLGKIANLQLTYSRLLFMQDRFPAYLEKEKPEDIRNQIDMLKAEMSSDSAKVKEIKAKRVKLMEKRIEAYGKAKENKAIVSAQLQTIEEMAAYIKDQPVVLKNTDSETSMIDNILAENENLESTIRDLEAVMSSEDIPSIGDYGDLGLNDLTTTGEETLKS